jgi:hypothetical protein
VSDELHDLVARAAVATDDAVARLPISGAERELMEEIMSTPVLVDSDVTRDEPAHTRRRARPALVAAAAAALTVVAGGLWLPRGSGGSQAYAAEAIRVADANPRVLVDAPGWHVIRVDEFTVTEGEMDFSNQKHGLDVNWRPADYHETFLEDRADAGKRVRIEVLGDSGWMFRYGDTTDFTTILPPHGPNFLEIRGDLGSEQAYRELLTRLTTVDVDTWLDAMPASAVKPEQREQTVDDMLQAIPLPAGFDRASIENPGGVNDRYVVGAQVMHAVTCAWIDQWREATQHGDQRAVADATAAMRTSRSWPILIEMNKDGDYPEAVWEIADKMRDGTLGQNDKMTDGTVDLDQVTCPELGP